MGARGEFRVNLYWGRERKEQISEKYQRVASLRGRSLSYVLETSRDHFG